jgi:hypothetical protein
MKRSWTVAVMLMGLLMPVWSQASPTLGFETGYVFTGLNDVRSPGLGGTFLAIADDLHAPPQPFTRLEVFMPLGGRHEIRALYAPLRLNARGVIQKDVRFEETVFKAGTPLLVSYRFDSYRITYRYAFLRRGAWQLSGGFTGKIRDAEIALYGDGRAAKANTGLVPLLHLRAAYNPGRTGLLLEADAAAAPQGRAEDVLFAVTHRFRPGVEAMVGYRLLEGGADNDEVYSFAFLHYALVGLRVTL